MIKNKQKFKCNKYNKNGKKCKRNTLQGFNTCYDHVNEWKFDLKNKYIENILCDDYSCYYCNTNFR